MNLRKFTQSHNADDKVLVHFADGRCLGFLVCNFLQMDGDPFIDITTGNGREYLINTNNIASIEIIDKDGNE